MQIDKENYRKNFGDFTKKIDNIEDWLRSCSRKHEVQQIKEQLDNLKTNVGGVDVQAALAELKNDIRKLKLDSNRLESDEKDLVKNLAAGDWKFITDKVEELMTFKE